jgi:hypothetical protein
MRFLDRPKKRAGGLCHSNEPSLQAKATVDALRAICELDLSKLDSLEPLRGFGRDRDYPNYTALVESIFRLY